MPICYSSPGRCLPTSMVVFILSHFEGKFDVNDFGDILLCQTFVKFAIFLYTL